MNARLFRHLPLFTLAIGVSARADDPAPKRWTFDDDKIGVMAAGFTSEVGTWAVVAVGQGRALAQTAKNSKPTFNLALVDGMAAKDVDISVQVTARAGQIDQGGGIVWRAKDAKNYYLARYNPLEDNFRLYKVIDGTRTQLATADVTHSSGPHTLRVAMTGDRVLCYYDGKKYLDHQDDALPSSGQIGLWTKSDAQTQFDDLTLSGK
jgi:hypothetical protein